ncbi:hypothetical protein PMAYCL1PPCAC_20992, partial [Pristionchus mayeri]
MADEIIQDDSCLRAIGAAIADSADVSVLAGSLLRRATTDYATFATRLDEELAGATQEQLQKTYKTIDNFCLALNGTLSSLGKRIYSNNHAGDADELMANENFSNAAIDDKPCSSKARSSKTLKSLDETHRKGRTVDSTEWMATAEQYAKSRGDQGGVLEARLQSIGLKQSGVQIAQMPLSEFESIINEKQLSPENLKTVKEIRKKLRKRYREIHERQVKNLSKTRPVLNKTVVIKPVASKKKEGTHLRVDYDGLLASVGLSYSFEQVGMMSLADFNRVLSQKNLDAGQTSLVKMIRARGKTRFNSGGRTRDQMPRKSTEKKKK